MMRLVRLHPELIDLLPVTDIWRGPNTLHDDPALRLLACGGHALALLDGGRVMAAGGVLRNWPGRGTAWLIPGAWMERRHWGFVLGACRDGLAALIAAGTYRRIEIAVDPRWPERTAWARRLGFDLEGRMRAYLPDGGDNLLMARVAPPAPREPT